VAKNKKVKVVNLYSASSCISYTLLMRFSSLTRAVDRTAAACSLQTQAGAPAGSPVSCTKVPTFRNPYNGLLI